MIQRVSASRKLLITVFVCFPKSGFERLSSFVPIRVDSWIVFTGSTSPYDPLNNTKRHEQYKSQQLESYDSSRIFCAKPEFVMSDQTTAGNNGMPDFAHWMRLTSGILNGFETVHHQKATWNLAFGGLRLAALFAVGNRRVSHRLVE